MYIKGPKYRLTEKEVLEHVSEEPGVFELWENCNILIFYDVTRTSLRKQLLKCVVDYSEQTKTATHFAFEVTTAENADARLGELMSDYVSFHRELPPANDITRPFRPVPPKSRRGRR
jgi:hypothetical protein